MKHLPVLVADRQPATVSSLDAHISSPADNFCGPVQSHLPHFLHLPEDDLMLMSNMCRVNIMVWHASEMPMEKTLCCEPLHIPCCHDAVCRTLELFHHGFQVHSCASNSIFDPRCVVVLPDVVLLLFRIDLALLVLCVF